MIKNTTKTQKLCWALFLLYLIGLTYFTFFAEALGRGTSPDGDLTARFNLIPFREIQRFWIYRSRLGIAAFVLNVFGNIIAFMPCGFLLPAISRRSRKWPGVLAVGLCVSFLIECTQLLFRVGSFDVDDLLLNVTGVLLGFGLNRIIQSVRIRKKRSKEERRVRIRMLSVEQQTPEALLREAKEAACSVPGEAQKLPEKETKTAEKPQTRQ